MKKLNHYKLYTTDISHLININLSPLSYVPSFISSVGWSFRCTCAKCVSMHTHYKYSFIHLCTLVLLPGVLPSHKLKQKTKTKWKNWVRSYSLSKFWEKSLLTFTNKGLQDPAVKLRDDTWNDSLKNWLHKHHLLCFVVQIHVPASYFNLAYSLSQHKITPSQKFPVKIRFCFFHLRCLVRVGTEQRTRHVRRQNSFILVALIRKCCTLVFYYHWYIFSTNLIHTKPWVLIKKKRLYYFCCESLIELSACFFSS